MNKHFTVFALLVLAMITQAAPGTQEQIKAAAEALRPKLIEMRRDFHMHPELSNREERTARVVAERLRALGLEEIKTGVAKHGVVALLKGGKPGPVVAVRADMDALPIQETIEVPYKSRNPGVKHACGHDVHTTVQLGVAEVLGKLRSQIPGTIKFIFQPAEEGPPTGEEGGASLMIKEGALENPKPKAIFGLHVAPDIEVGKIGYSAGAAMASSDRILITIRGKMTHGAWPHDGVDAIVVAAECINALQTIRSRKIDTQDPIVLSIGTIHGGNRNNIIADEVKMEGTFRTLNETYRARIPSLIEQVLAGVTAAHGAKYEFRLTNDGNPVTFNEPALAEATLPILKGVLGEGQVVRRRPVMGAEDFSYYQKVIPGFYYWLGVRNSAKGITNMIHTAEFDADEESLVVGVKVMANVLIDFLERESR
ncbi:MAG: amidohydrolase [Verrucomicrobiota bacterium]|jgi:amidohydrolase